MIKHLKPKSKIWLEKDGKLVFGDGKAEILMAVKKTGSLSGAAKKLKMSYRHTWGYINAIEKRLGVKLIEKKIGGKGGGGSKLTECGKDLLKRYKNFRQGINEMVDKKFKETFAGGYL